jgi:ribosomal protein S18 acetylase RimI-like enzyme
MDEVVIREGRSDEAHVLARCFRQMWLDVGVKPTGIHDDWRERVEHFVEHGRRELDLRFFLAETGGEVVGSGCAQRFAGLYPDLLRPCVRQYGYVWGVWVAESHRRRGLGKALTERCIESLRADGCSHVLLHAAPMGRGIYERLGFEPTNELRLRLPDDDPTA